MRWVLIFAILSAGCAAEPVINDGSDVVFVVPGVGGTGGYDMLVEAVARPSRSVLLHTWGAPAALFFLNFSDKGIHDEAEETLARRIEQWHTQHPTGKIDLIGHSAGGGVVLGALPKLKTARVRNVILLGPSVSPGYDVHPTLTRVDGVIHMFYSERDNVMLGWRTGNFGTYDRVQTQAAGHLGFAGDYPRDKLLQYAYDPKWEKLGNKGGHWDTLAGPFSRLILAPMLPP